MKISKSLQHYKDTHPYCEACRRSAQGLPYHIKTRGAGGGDEPENLLSLCHYCHYGIVHSSLGIRGLIEKYPHLRNKVLKMKPALAVLMLSGKR